MKKIDALSDARLFSNVAQNDIKPTCECLHTYTKKYAKGEFVFHAGETIHEISLPFSGSLVVQTIDYWGNRSIVERVRTGDLYGIGNAIDQRYPLNFDVVAFEDSEVMFIDFTRLTTQCSNACPAHAMMIRNLFKAYAALTRGLSQKIGVASQRTTRGKLMTYLSTLARNEGSSSFNVPFNRQELADYLCVERSAMSRELGKLRDEGIIKVQGSHFELLRNENKPISHAAKDEND